MLKFKLNHNIGKQNNLKSLGASKSKGQNRVSKIGNVTCKWSKLVYTFWLCNESNAKP
jgi:hypothetical protein